MTAGVRTDASALRGGRKIALSTGDLYVAGLSWSLAAYAMLGKGFAYAGIPPLFIGEVLFGLGILVFLRTSCATGVLASFPNLVFLTLAVWTLARTVPYLPVYGLNALRDAVVVLYGGFALIVCALLIERPARLVQGLRLFARFAAIYGATAGLLYSLQIALTNSGLLPSWPTSGTPILDLKPGDVAVHLAGSAVFALMFYCRIVWLWVALLACGMAVVGVHNRGGLVAMLLPLGVAFALSGRMRQLSGVLLAGAVVLLLGWILDLNFSMTARERPLSVHQLFLNVASILGQADHDELDDTKAWRLLWWRAIQDYTLHGEYFWSGKGFGISLAAADGIVGPAGPGATELRSPHNVNMTLLARAGVPGLLLWLALLLSWFAMMLRGMLLARRRAEEEWFRLLLFVSCYLAAVFINASFDVALEGPMLGIWFWVLFGFGVGATQIYRTHRAAYPGRTRHHACTPRLYQGIAGSAPGAAR